MALNDVLDRIDTDIDTATDHLLDLLRIPSISTDPAFKSACEDAADWLVEDLNGIGIKTTKRSTPGHPMVVGHVDGPADKPHILFYGHYDVQPVDPLDLWDRDPFDPAIEETAKGRVIRGRGAADDKGQLMTIIEALRAWKAVNGDFPCRMTLFLEGEEESGSPSLVPFMNEITITGPDLDLHSGMYGGVAMNPARVLSKIIAALHDDTGRITVPDFYDGVPELPDNIQAQWQGLAFDHKTFLGDVGLSVPAGEQDRMPIEMIWSRPTCEVNGMWSGYTGAGFKTVLPSQAHAKISFRLVGTQDPLTIRESFRKMVSDMVPPDCKVSFQAHGASQGSVFETVDPAFEKARNALTDEWNIPAAYVGCGGSIPIAGHFQKILDTTPVLIGFGKDDDAIHSPNEKYDMQSFHKGIRSWARILDALT